MSSTPTTPTWQTTAQQYRAAVAAKIPPEWLLDPQWTTDLTETSAQNVLSIPKECGILTPRELDLTSAHDAVALLALLSSGQITAHDLTTAFCKRAAIAHQLTTCLTETLFPAALARARALDDHYATHGTPIGPLHGLPISLKDSFNIAGVHTTLGYVSFIAHGPATADAALVRVLLDLGAVPYVKTNVPQSLMTADTDNHVFGRTLNPRRLDLGAGGSSGGEGALLALHGSPLGVGTDIGGSIRIPAYVNGALGLKPSVGRVPYGGQKGPGRAGSPWIVPVAGPLTRSVRDAEMFMRAVLGADTWAVDETCIPHPWRHIPPSPTPPKLTLGLILESPTYPLHPPVLRALRSATNALTAAGHTVIPLLPLLPPNFLDDAMALAFQGFVLDPQRTPQAHMRASGEPAVPSITTAAPPELWQFVPTMDALFDMNARRADMAATVRNLWVERALDGILMPTYQGTAAPHDRYGSPMYTVLANLLEYPALTIPYLHADATLDADYRRDDVVYTPSYVPEQCEGMPTGFQLLGRPHKDEELVAMAPVVLEALGVSGL